jgi:hypothetical protein
MTPMLAAVVRLTPKVKVVWPIATPRQPRPAIESRSFGAKLLSGSRMRSTAYMRRPPTKNRTATTEMGGMARAANLVAA